MNPFFQAWAPRVLSVLRIVTGFIFLLHGTAKILHWPHIKMFDNLQLASLMGVQGLIELVGGVLMMIGLFTSPVAFVLSGDMAFAYFIGHFPKGWMPVLNGGDAAVLYCFVFLYLWLAGPGPWSLDARMRKA